jgi:hypothetical protein
LLICVNIHRELSIAVYPLTKDGVGHLIKMKRLHTLQFADSRNFDKQHRDILFHDLDLIISIAGQVPSLKNFGFFERVGNENEFIHQFGIKYPEKQLVVNNLLYVHFLVIS